MPSPPPPLPDELVEEVLLRFPPETPAALVRAVLVCRRWWRLVSDPGFCRRFREFHRSPPMLGMLCNFHDQTDMARFVPTTAFCTPRTDFRGMHVLDARHGRVLFKKDDDSVLAVWDPITDQVREFSFPLEVWGHWTAAILCSIGGSCDHLDCHHGHFLVVFVSDNRDGNATVYTYSSDAASWSELVIGQDRIFAYSNSSALVGNAVYFQYYDRKGIKTLKYNFELRQVSMIQRPSSVSMYSLPLVTAMEDGGLGLINKDDSKLRLWSMKDINEVDAIWERAREFVIELSTVFPIDVDVKRLSLIGSGVGIIFMSAGAEVYTIDLKTYEVKKVYKESTYNVIPYMSFYTPALKGSLHR